MPRVPTRTGASVSTTPLREARQQPESIDVQGLASGLGDLSRGLAERQITLDQTAAVEAETEYTRAINDYLYTSEDAYYKKTGKDALNASPIAADQLNEIRERIASDLLTNDQQRSMFGRATERAHENNQVKIALQSDRALKQWNLTASQSRVAVKLEESANDPSPETLDNAWIHISEEIESQGELLGLPPETIGENLRNARSGQLSAAISTSIARSTDEAAGLIEQYADDLSSTDEAGLRKSLKATIAQNEREQEAELAELRELRASDLEIAIDRDPLNGPDESDIDRAFGEGVITGPARTRLYAKRQAGIERFRLEELNQQLISDAIKSGQRLDPKNKIAKTAVDAYYKAIPGDPLTPEHNGHVVRLVGQTGVIPESLKGQIRALAVPGGSADALGVSNLIDQMMTEAPELADQIPAREKAFSLKVSQLVRSGMEPDRAIEVMYKNVYEQDKSVTDALKAAFRESDGVEKNAEELQDFIDDEFDVSLFPFSSGPASTAEMQADYNALTENYYLMTQDADAARSLAWTDIKRVWGVSKINGEREMMKYPPELFGNTSQEEAIAELNAAGISGELKFIADRDTARTGTYAIIQQQTGGFPRFISSRWQPSVQMNGDVQKALDEARASRDKLREIEAKIAESDRVRGIPFVGQ